MNRAYRWAGGAERLRTQGELLPHKVLILPALFDEANRMRRFTVRLAAMLVARGVGSILPDLPGTGESRAAPDRLDWSDWERAVADLRDLLPDETRHTVAIRGGALLDGAGAPTGGTRAWRLSPEPGDRIVRMLDRVDAAGGPGARGYPMSAAFRAGLAAARPGDGANVHTVRLMEEPGEADTRVAGMPLWRRAEPGEDEAMAARVADDVAAWALAG